MSRDPLGRNDDTVRALADAFTHLTDEQWQALGKFHNDYIVTDAWGEVTEAIAESRTAPPMVNAIRTAGIRAASRVFDLSEEYSGGRYQRSAAREYPGSAMPMVAVSHKHPRGSPSSPSDPWQTWASTSAPSCPHPTPTTNPPARAVPPVTRRPSAQRTQLP